MSQIKRYRPAPFIPTSSVTGGEDAYVFRGRNMWLKFSRFGQMYAEGYTGSRDLSESVDTKEIANGLVTFIAWTSDSQTITGTLTTFTTDLRQGQFVLGIDAANDRSELFVVEKVISDTEFIANRAPKSTCAGGTAVVMPVVMPIGLDRGTAIAGKVLRYPKGHYLGVGDGLFKINGSSIGTGFQLSKTPKFAIYDPTGPSYTFSAVGITRPAAPTLASVTAPTYVISSITYGSPVRIQFTIDHKLFNGDEIDISGHDPAGLNGRWVITRVNSTTIDLNDSNLTGPTVTPGTVTGKTSLMKTGGYNIRICAKNTQTLGFSNPSDVIAPVQITSTPTVSPTMIKVTFNGAMADNVDAYDIYSTQFIDNSNALIEARYNGPWYLVTTATDEMLKDTGGSTPTGRESGTFYEFAFSDLQIESARRILTFNNFAPEESEFVDMMNGIPIYFSCLGRRTTAKMDGASPGPTAIPSKPSNPEAVFLDKTITTAGNDYIVGEFNAKSRIFVLCQNTLQALVLTTLDEEPIAFRSLWNCGFINPYNAAFVKDYIYAFGTQKFVRGVAGGDDSSMEFAYASDIQDYTINWKTGHVLVAYDPKNRAVCHFYAAYERESDYWVTLVLPFMLDQQIWNMPIVLKKANQDFIVSGVAEIGQDLVFVAGGRNSSNAVVMGTYVFDGGDSEEKEWYIVWNYSDDGAEMNPKTAYNFTVTGRFSADSASDTNTKLKIYGPRGDGLIEIDGLTTGSSSDFSRDIPHSTALKRYRSQKLDWGPFPLYTFRIEGKYTTTVDRFDELVIEGGIENTRL